MRDDRWWRGLDAVVVEALPRGARVVDVGCGDGGLVERLAAAGLDALGVDPAAPERPRLLRSRLEDAAGIGPFDAATAVMSLHHADLEAVSGALARLVRPDGRVVVSELAWEAYDDASAAWVARYDDSGADNSVSGWHREHADLNPTNEVVAALDSVFALAPEHLRPYLARMLRRPELEPEEHALIDAGALPPLGRWYVGSRRARPRLASGQARAATAASPKTPAARSSRIRSAE